MDPHNRAQDVLRCDLCEENVVQMHCDTCLVKLCKTCVGDHISSDEREDHKVVRFQFRKCIPVYPTCALHDSKRCEMHCQQCTVPICFICATSEKHVGHRFRKIVDIFDEKKREFEKKIKDIQENIRVKHADQASKMEKRIADIEKEFTILLDTVSKHGEELKREIDQIVKEMQSEIKSIRKNHMELLTTRKTEVQQNLTEIDKEVSSLKERLDSNDINKVFHFTPNNKIYKSLSDDPVLTMPVFSTKRIDSVQLREMFGTLSDIVTKPTAITKVRLMETPLMVHRIATGYSHLYGVAFLDRIRIWATGDAQQIKLFDVNDNSIKKSIDTKLSGEKLVSVTIEGDLLYTEKGGRTIHIVKREQSEKLINLQGWRIQGFCVTSAGDLLVVMTSVSDYDRETRVVRYHGREEKEIIQFESKEKPFYSVGPNQKCICENRNFDICVADRDACAVVVVRQDTKLRFRYEGNPSSLRKTEFKPKGITTDSLSNILVSDLGNGCVHVVDQNGKFLTFIDCPRVQPWGLCVGLDNYLCVADYASGDVIKIWFLQ
ncbi:E3 ubiquitin-protein ligase TRIM71-like [Ostrea edulis]|uniref:E3 ubiquitin-protein ligase TRIM71-like n=1 Tax=Ostrea edulis TaxID=37623 RepID=UPI0024AFF636|nr:E3 ubiquitin-protein ligase TRIM71-like [Ostrea edulis]